MNLPRTTIAQPTRLQGVTLFTATPSLVTFRPAPLGTGIVFIRADLADHPVIPALASHVLRADQRRTVLALNAQDPHSPRIETVEHVLAAVRGVGITDLFIDVHAPELPILDGSALPFIQALQAAALKSLGTTPARPITLSQPIVLEFEEGKSRIEAHPTSGAHLELTYNLEYPPGAPISPQSAMLTMASGQPSTDFISQIAPARTFCLAQEAQMLRQMGLFAHMTPKDMLVIGPTGPIDNAYRFPDEPARHKLLDLLGDLAVIGNRPLHARIVAHRTGHAANHALAAALAALP